MMRGFALASFLSLFRGEGMAGFMAIFVAAAVDVLVIGWCEPCPPTPGGGGAGGGSSIRVEDDALSMAPAAEGVILTFEARWEEEGVMICVSPDWTWILHLSSDESAMMRCLPPTHSFLHLFPRRVNR